MPLNGDNGIVHSMKPEFLLELPLVFMYIEDAVVVAVGGCLAFRCLLRFWPIMGVAANGTTLCKYEELEAAGAGTDRLQLAKNIEVAIGDE